MPAVLSGVAVRCRYTAIAALLSPTLNPPPHPLHITSADVLQPPDQLQLWKEEALLEDAKKLAELKIENDDVVAMCYQTAGEQTCSRWAGTWRWVQQLDGRAAARREGCGRGCGDGAFGHGWCSITCQQLRCSCSGWQYQQLLVVSSTCNCVVVSAGASCPELLDGRCYVKPCCAAPCPATQPCQLLSPQLQPALSLKNSGVSLDHSHLFSLPLCACCCAADGLSFEAKDITPVDAPADADGPGAGP
jgi:hypothetical protein